MFPALSEREAKGVQSVQNHARLLQPESPSGELKRLQKWAAEWFKEERWLCTSNCGTRLCSDLARRRKMYQ